MAPTHHPETPPHPTPTPLTLYALTRRGWDLLDFLDVMFVRMLHVYKEYGRYYGPHPPPRNPPPPHPHPPPPHPNRRWDLLDIMDVMTLYALTRRGWDLLDFLDVMCVRMLHVYKEYGRYYGPHPPPRNPPHPTPWDLLGFLDVMFVRMLHVYKEYGSFYSDDIIRDRLCAHVRSFVCTCELDLRAHVRSLVCTCEFWPHLCVHVS